MSSTLDAIKRLYHRTTASTVQRDLTRAIELFKALPAADQERAAVYMDGLSQMRSEWALEGKAKRSKQARGTKGVPRSSRTPRSSRKRGS